MTTAFTKDQAHALCQVLDAWPNTKIVVIGAAALHCQLLMTGRRTHDVDITVLADVATVMEKLQSLSFVRDPKLEHRWTTARGVVLDVLPVTTETIARGKLVWPESGYVMNVFAFDLLSSHTSRVELDHAHTIEIATVATIVILKMAAWLDRSHDRDRDVQDIGYLLSAYLPDEDERRWDDPELGGFEHEAQAARALGLDIVKIAQPHHTALVHTFLERLGDSESYAFSLMATAARAAGGDPEEMLQMRLGAFRSAFT